MVCASCYNLCKGKGKSYTYTGKENEGRMNRKLGQETVCGCAHQRWEVLRSGAETQEEGPEGRPGGCRTGS